MTTSELRKHVDGLNAQGDAADRRSSDPRLDPAERRRSAEERDAFWEQAFYAEESLYERLEASGDAAAVQSAAGVDGGRSERYREAHPDDKKANRAAGNAAMAKGDYKTAIKRYTASGSMSRLAAAQAADGDVRGALASARAALRSNPADKRALGLVNILGGQGNPTVKVRGPAFESARDPGSGAPDRGNPAKPAAPSAPGAAKPASAAEAPPLASGPTAADDRRAASLLLQSSARLELGDVRGAVRFADEALATGRRGGEAHLVRGRAAAADGDPRRAVEEESASMDGDAALVDALLQKTWAEIEARDAEEARADASAALRVGRKHPKSDLLESLLKEPAEVLLSSASATAAARAPASSLPDIPESADGISPRSLALAREAKVRLELGDAKEALKLAQAALSLDARNYFADIVLSACWRALRDFKRAVRAADAAIAKSPRAAAALLIRGEAHRALGAYREAAADASALLRLDPGSSAAYRLRSAARRELGDRAGAAADEAEAERLEGRAGQRPTAGRGRLLAAAVGSVALLGAAFALSRR